MAEPRRRPAIPGWLRLWRAQPAWHLYFAAREAHLAAPDGLTTSFVFDDPADGARRALSQAAAVEGRPKIQVWLSGALARPFVIQPVAGLRRWPEAHALAEATGPAATGLDTPCAVVLERFPYPDASIATAMERQLCDVLAVGAAGVRPASVRPWWTRALACSCKRLPHARLLLVEEPDALTVFAGQNGGFAHASTYAPPPDIHSLGQILARLRLTLGVEPGSMQMCKLRAARDVGSAGDVAFATPECAE